MANIPTKVQTRLTAGIKKFQNVLKAAKTKDRNESDTVTIIMDMLSELFGYDKYSEITSEYAIKKTYCDLAIKIDNKLRFLIEIKAIGLDLKSDHIKQVVDYGSNQGVDWVILTNGTNWKVFKIIFGKPVENELVYEFDFMALNAKKPADIDLLYYVSKESLGKSALEDYRLQKQTLSKFYIGQILITEPILDCIKRTLKKLSPDVKVSTDEIREVLILDVLKREVFEDEKAEEARKKVNKIFKTPAKKEPQAKAVESSIDKQHIA
jgi:hypothetical protein